jgi:hypothetical protein
VFGPISTESSRLLGDAPAASKASAQVSGLLVDLRTTPREVWQIAFDQGMIPYIPADKEAE